MFIGEFMKEAINSEVVIIDRSGKPHYMGEVNSPILHNDYLLKYINRYYPNEEEFNGVNEDTHNRETVYHLLNMGDVVYLNGGFGGSIFLPEIINEPQIKAIYDLALDLGIQPVLLNYEPSTDLGFPIYQAIGNEEDSLKEVMDEYMSRLEEKNSHLKR